MADLAYAIVSSSELAAWLGQTYDDLETPEKTVLEQIVNGITVFIENYCDRRIVARSADIEEVFDGDGTADYFVKHPPIVSITSIEVENTADIDTTDTDEVRWDAATGHIWLLQASFAESFPQNCTVAYKGGYSTVPQDLWLAAAKMAKLIWLARDKNQELIRSVSNSLTGDTTNFLDSILTPDIRNTLDRYILRRYP